MCTGALQTVDGLPATRTWHMDHCYVGPHRCAHMQQSFGFFVKDLVLQCRHTNGRCAQAYVKQCMRATVSSLGALHDYAMKVKAVPRPFANTHWLHKSLKDCIEGMCLTVTCCALQVVFEGVPTHPTPARCWEVIQKHGVKMFYTAPTAIRSLMGLGDEWVKACDLSSLQVRDWCGACV